MRGFLQDMGITGKNVSKLLAGGVAALLLVHTGYMMGKYPILSEVPPEMTGQIILAQCTVAAVVLGLVLVALIVVVYVLHAIIGGLKHILSQQAQLRSQRELAKVKEELARKKAELAKKQRELADANAKLTQPKTISYGTETPQINARNMR